MKRSRILCIGVVLVVSICLGQRTSLAALPQGYKIEVLGGQATAINNRGDIAFSPDRAINNLGQTVGRVDEQTIQTGINDTGQVCGYRVVLDGTNWNEHSFFWEGGVATDLGVGDAYGINNSGQVVGLAGSGAMFRWQKGRGFLGFGQGLPGADGLPRAINDLGQVVGECPSALGFGRGFLWTNSTDDWHTDMGQIIDLGMPFGADEVDPRDINNVGQVVGEYRGQQLGGSWHAFLWENGTFVDLQSYLPLDSDPQPYRAMGINDSGQIVGVLYGGGSFIMTPTPEPATLSLLALGAVALCRRRIVGFRVPAG